MDCFTLIVLRRGFKVGFSILYILRGRDIQIVRYLFLLILIAIAFKNILQTIDLLTRSLLFLLLLRANLILGQAWIVGRLCLTLRLLEVL